MASRKQSSFDNQNSDEMGSKDKLISVTGNLQDPYKAQASDFPVKKVAPANGQGVDGSGEQDKLVPWGGNLTSPRHVEIPAEGESDSMSSRQSAVSGNFKVSRNAGESGVAPMSIDLAESINLGDGCIEVKGYKRTKTWEVAEDKVTIG